MAIILGRTTQYEHVIAAIEAEAVVDGLTAGETYRIAVAAVDMAGHVGQDSDAILVVVGGESTVAPEPDQWSVFAQPGTLYSDTVPGDTGDVFDLIAGPDGSTLDSTSGLFEWNVPEGADGWFEVLAHVTHSDGTKAVRRFQLLTDSSDPLWTPGTLDATTVDDNTIEITTPAGVDVTGILQYQLERNGQEVGEWQASPRITDSGLTPNTQYEYRVQTKDSFVVEHVSIWSDSISTYTLAETPAAPILGSPTPTSVVLAGLGEDSNPAGTEYSVWHVNSSMYVAADGALVAEPAWLTADAWTNTTIVGLEEDTEQEFSVIARNADDMETVPGPSAKIWTLRETDPPTVVSVAALGSEGVFSIVFSEPVAISLKDMDLTDIGSNSVNISGAGFSYLPSDNAAILDLTGIVSNGQYTLALSGDAVQDLASNLLDGDENGVAGGDYHHELAIPAVVALPGDFNADGIVEQGDLDLVLLNWGSSGNPAPAGWVNDLPDSTIGQNELDRVKSNWGNTSSIPTSVIASAVAQPTTTTVSNQSLQARWNEPRTSQLGPLREIARDRALTEFVLDSSEPAQRERVFAVVAETRRVRRMGPNQETRQDRDRVREHVLDLSLAEYLDREF